METRFDLNASLSYFDALQQEFLSFVLRSQLFDSPGIKKKNRDIAAMKRVKIIEIANKLGVLSLLDCDHIYGIQIDKFLRHNHFPNMQYRSEIDPVAYWDNVAIMKEGTIVYYGERSCRILDNNPVEKTVLVEFCKGKKKRFRLPYPYFTMKISLPDRGSL